MIGKYEKSFQHLIPKINSITRIKWYSKNNLKRVVDGKYFNFTLLRLLSSNIASDDAIPKRLSFSNFREGKQMYHSNNRISLALWEA